MPTRCELLRILRNQVEVVRIDQRVHELAISSIDSVAAEVDEVATRERATRLLQAGRSARI
jgi:hypothetical protein